MPFWGSRLPEGWGWGLGQPEGGRGARSAVHALCVRVLRFRYQQRTSLPRLPGDTLRASRIAV